MCEHVNILMTHLQFRLGVSIIYCFVLLAQMTTEKMLPHNMSVKI